MCDCHTGCLSSPLHHTSADMEPPERLMISYSAGCHIQARKQNKACSSLLRKKQQHFTTAATTIAVHTVSTAQAFKIIWLGGMVLHYITYFIHYFNVHRCSLNRIQVDRHPHRFPYSPRRETLMQEVGILNFEHSQLYRARPHVWSIPEAHYSTQDNIIINITWTFLCLTLFSCRWRCTVSVALLFGLMQQIC